MSHRPVLLSAALLVAAACGPRGEGLPPRDAGPTAGGATPVPLQGHYATDTLKSADLPDRVITLELKGDSTAILRSEVAGKDKVEEKGQWSAVGPNVTLIFSSGGTDTMGWRLVSSRLVPVAWNRETYGVAGLTLNRH